jgi:regulatory protein
MSDEQQPPELFPGAITGMERQQHDAGRISIFLNGAFAFGLAEDVVVSAGLHRGMELEVEAQQALLAEDAFIRARIRALDYIAFKARTEHEVRQKLARSGFPEEIAERAIGRIRELGYLDDEAYARAYVRGRLTGRGHGPVRLRADLLRRGLARELIDRALAEQVEEDDLLEAARRQARQRWQRLASEADPRRRRKKAFDFLLRRGFDFDTARQVVDELETEG